VVKEKEPSSPEEKPYLNEIMASTYSSRKFMIAVSLISAILIVSVYIYRLPLWEGGSYFYRLVSDREEIRKFISGFGLGAPFVFIGIQILQVILAPIPGEATGFIGGYLFGTLKGFLYSTIGLTAGSCVNFSIGRFLGERFVRKMIPPEKFKKYDRIIKRQGIIVLFIFFMFPGFPKDYLCLFLGLSTLPFKVFVLLAGIGRMPGTFLLSLQGAFLFKKDYTILGLTAGGCLLLVFLLYRYREHVYLWIERFNGS
jgi:uncharacterized membrane protein YdjX (TVP38/TMEM64 family)